MDDELVMETEAEALELELGLDLVDEECRVVRLANFETLDDLLALAEVVEVVEVAEVVEVVEVMEEGLEEAISGVLVDGMMESVSVGVAEVAATEATSAWTVVVKTAYSEGTLNSVMLQALI